MKYKEEIDILNKCIEILNGLEVNTDLMFISEDSAKTYQVIFESFRFDTKLTKVGKNEVYALTIYV